MICFALCVGGDASRYRAIAEPALRRLVNPDDKIWTVQGATGICSAYNEFIERAQANPDCEALVLLHDDVELLDPQLRARVLSVAGEPDVAIAGVVGGRDLWDGSWWYSRSWGGQAMYTTEIVGPTAQRSVDVDVVDGFLMILTRVALAELRFDDTALPAWHGYDTDICLAARQRGHRVVTRPIEALHRSKETLGDAEAFYAATAALRAKYPQLIRPLSPAERVNDLTRRAHRRAVRQHRARTGRRTLALREGPYEVEPLAPSPEHQNLVRAQSLHELGPRGPVLDLSQNPGFATAAQQAGFELHAINPSANDLAAWRDTHAELLADVVTWWEPGQGTGTETVREVLAEAAGTLLPGGRILLEVEQSTQMHTESLTHLAAQSGLRVHHSTTLSDQPYLGADAWRDAARAALLNHNPWPPRTLIRIVFNKEDT